MRVPPSLPACPPRSWSTPRWWWSLAQRCSGSSQTWESTHSSWRWLTGRYNACLACGGNAVHAFCPILDMHAPAGNMEHALPIIAYMHAPHVSLVLSRSPVPSQFEDCMFQINRCGRQADCCCGCRNPHREARSQKPPWCPLTQGLAPEPPSTGHAQHDVCRLPNAQGGAGAQLLPHSHL